MASIAQLRRLIGNPRAYAVQHEDHSWHPVRETPSNAVLLDHLDKEHTIGTYVLDGDKARTLIFDIDEGDDLRTALADAGRIKDALVDLGIPERSIGTEFSGNKGYHVWVLFGSYVEAKKLRRLGRAVLATSGVQCEVFPKQDQVKDLGNLVKLPHGVHRKTGKENPFIGRFPAPASVQVLDRILEELPPEPEKVRSEAAEIHSCVAAIADGPGDGWRNNGLYHLAVMLRRSRVLTEEQVVRAIYDAYNNMDQTDFSESEVEALIESSKMGGPMCQHLPDEVQCGDSCVMRKFDKLRPVPGMLKHAPLGTGQVVEVTMRNGKTLELSHPDLVQGKGVLE